MPTALGVNPSRTIPALAERAAERLVRWVGGRYAAPLVANVLRAAARVPGRNARR
jgi:choline dehydrogenase-like flavoprotein